MAESKEELKSLLMKVEPLLLKVESEKTFSLNIQKTKFMASGPITSWEIDGETVEKVSGFIFFFFGSKKMEPKTVTAAMTLKDAYSVE